MKTEKQIKIEISKIGTELMQEYEECDCISVDVATLEEKVPVEFFNEKSVLIVPIIKSGVLELRNSDVENDEILSDFEYLYNTDRSVFCSVLKEGWTLKKDDLTKRILDQTYKNRIIRLFFDAEMEGEEIKLHLAQITSYPIYNEIVVASGIEKYEHRWEYSATIISPLRVVNGEYEVQLAEFKDASTTVYERQKRNEKEIKRYMENLLSAEKLDTYPMEIFLKIMGYLNYIMEHPELKELEPKKNARTSGKQKVIKDMQKKTVAEDVRVREISLNGIKIRTANSKVANTMRSRQIHRVATCWGVRGHFRHYKKSGKTVYIEPYEKGKDASKRIKKHYKL